MPSLQVSINVPVLLYMWRCFAVLRNNNVDLTPLETKLCFLTHQHLGMCQSEQCWRRIGFNCYFVSFLLPMMWCTKICNDNDYSTLTFFAKLNHFKLDQFLELFAQVCWCAKRNLPWNKNGCCHMKQSQHQPVGTMPKTLNMPTRLRNFEVE